MSCVDYSKEAFNGKLKGHVAEAQRVCNYGDRAERHGGAGDDRAQEEAEKWVEHSGSDGHAEYVVGKREEEILANIAHGGAAEPSRANDGSQVALHQRDSR